MVEHDADFSDIDPDAIEGGTPNRPGWYRTVVHDVGPDPKKPEVILLTFKVVEGPFRGGLIYDRVYDPAYAEDTEKAATTKKRQALVAKRLGVWDGIDKKPHLDWLTAIDKEVVVHLTQNRNTGYVGVDFSGIYPLGHPQIPHDAFAPGGGNPPPGKKPSGSGSGRATRTAAKEPAGPKADPYAGL